MSTGCDGVAGYYDSPAQACIAGPLDEETKLLLELLDVKCGGFAVPYFTMNFWGCPWSSEEDYRLFNEIAAAPEKRHIVNPLFSKEPPLRLNRTFSITPSWW